ACKPLQLPLTF
nr:immunoglobulin light chain junction region [Macaca mulatta]